MIHLTAISNKKEKAINLEEIKIGFSSDTFSKIGPSNM